MIGKTLGIKKVLSLILCFVFVMATVLMSPKSISTFNALDGSAGQDVTSLLSDIVINMTDLDHGNTVVVSDNSAIKPLYVNTRYEIKINWAIQAAKYYRVDVGDYFYLDISDEYFSFTDSVAAEDLVYNGQVIGNWEIKDNKIYCRFTQDCKNFTQVSGYFKATGTLVSTIRDSVDVTLAGVPILMQFNPTATRFTHSGSPALSGGGSLLKNLRHTTKVNSH